MTGPRTIAALDAGAPLRDLDEEDLGAYAGSAIWTMGTEHDFLYFTPRILELMRDGAVVGMASYEMMTRKLIEAAVDPVDRDLVGRYFLALLRNHVERADVWSALDALRGAAHVVDDADALVAIFVPARTLTAAELLAECCRGLFDRDFVPGRVIGALAREETIDALSAAHKWLTGRSDEENEFDADFDWATADANLLASIVRRRDGAL